MRKLLALSRSTNPYEAALAAERAVDIAQRHNLDLARVSMRAETYVERGLDVGAAAAWRWLLLAAIAEAHFCRALRRRERGRLLTEMFLIGESHNVDLCGFLYSYLAREVERLATGGWRRAQAVYGDYVQARSWKNEFRRGAVATIGERLRERRERFADESVAANALVVAKEAGLLDVLGRMYPNLGTSRLRFRPRSDAYARGQHAARDIALRQPLRTSPAGQRALT